MKLSELQALFFKRIHHWRMHDRIPQARIVAVADVVRHDEDDVRKRWGRGVEKGEKHTTESAQDTNANLVMVHLDFDFLLGLSPVAFESKLGFC